MKEQIKTNKNPILLYNKKHLEQPSSYCNHNKNHVYSDIYASISPSTKL